MGAGVPAVATAVAGIPEVIAHERTGLLVPPADVPALGAALARLVTDAACRERMAQAGRASVLPRFGVAQYVDSITRLYDRLLGQAA
jgi:glycosyltransferase involved in cell wall biosynthesis